jgi:predicted SprT family Zn-dependent metalloprotease
MEDVQEYICDNCETVILDERDLYEIEYFKVYWCEECMFNYMDGPVDPDEVDILAEQLEMI